MDPDGELFWNTSRVEERVRRTMELITKGVNFWELMNNENKALKANCVEAQMREKMETGRYKSPTEYSRAYAAKITPSAMYIAESTKILEGLGFMIMLVLLFCVLYAGRKYKGMRTGKPPV